jgi:hypothetical protein
VQVGPRWPTTENRAHSGFGTGVAAVEKGEVNLEPGGKPPSSVHSGVDVGVEATTKIAVGQMSEDLSFGDWSTVTPEAMRTYSETKLHAAMTVNRGGVFDAWARHELERRRDERLSDLLDRLKEATDKVYKEVAILNSSSDRLEKLTKTLKNLTWALIFLTAVAAVVPVGTEIWKAQKSAIHSSADQLQPAPALALQSR